MEYLPSEEQLDPISLLKRAMRPSDRLQWPCVTNPFSRVSFVIRFTANNRYEPEYPDKSINITNSLLYFIESQKATALINLEVSFLGVLI